MSVPHTKRHLLLEIGSRLASKAEGVADIYSLVVIRLDRLTAWRLVRYPNRPSA